MKHTRNDDAKIYDVIDWQEGHEETIHRLEYINLWLILFFMLTISLLLIGAIGWGAYYLMFNI